MKVILLEDIPKLGKAGEVVQVKDGYGRNYLIPQKKALDACEGNVRRFEHQRRIMEARLRKKMDEANKLAQKVSSLRLTIVRKAGEEEKLFGSVTSADIERALEAEGVKVDRKAVKLEEPIKKLGIYTVPVKVYRDVTADLKVWVVPESEDKGEH